MRERLFKGIPKDKSTFLFFQEVWKDCCDGDFVKGSLIVSKGRCYICVSAMCKINSTINNGITSMIEVIPETVGQYTGLTDKNGNHIYEGDIVKHYCSSENKTIFDVGQFYWCENICQFRRTSRTEGQFYDVNSSCEYEVIGNIHDNPELLKGDDTNA